MFRSFECGVQFAKAINIGEDGKAIAKNSGTVGAYLPQLIPALVSAEGW